MDTSVFAVPVPPWAQKELEKVHNHVREALPSTLQAFWDSNGFGIAGFDRQPLRPYLVLLVARHYACTGPRPLRLAGSIHMIHMASLLHDRLGYGRPVPGSGKEADREYHQREALDILLGDFFFSKASRVIVEDGETRVIQEHIQTSLESAETQARLVSLDKELDRIEPATCFEVVADKVSLLLTLGLRVGAILGKAPKDEEEALSDYGFFLGRVVRILEDLALWERPLGVVSPLTPDTKFSHPLILLWEKEGREAWTDAVRRIDGPDRQSLEALRVLLHDRGYLTASKRAAFGFAGQALGRLKGLNQTEEVRSLEGIARFHFSSGRPQGQEMGL